MCTPRCSDPGGLMCSCTQLRAKPFGIATGIILLIVFGHLQFQVRHRLRICRASRSLSIPIPRAEESRVRVCGPERIVRWQGHRCYLPCRKAARVANISAGLGRIQTVFTDKDGYASAVGMISNGHPRGSSALPQLPTMPGQGGPPGSDSTIPMALR